MKERREETLSDGFRRGLFDLYQITCGSRVALTCKNVWWRCIYWIMWQILEHRRDDRLPIRSITHTCVTNFSWGFICFFPLLLFLYLESKWKTLCCHLVPIYIFTYIYPNLAWQLRSDYMTEWMMNGWIDRLMDGRTDGRMSVCVPCINLFYFFNHQICCSNKMKMASENKNFSKDFYMKGSEGQV